MMALRTTIRRAFLPVFITLIASLAAEPGSGVVASPESGWPQFRGPRRDGISDETGLLQAWPEGGPELLWSASGLGQGYSSPIIVDGSIYITGDVGDQLVIHALDLEGKARWTAVNGRSWTGPWPGARAACAYAGGRLFHKNAHGRVACLDPAQGEELWAVDTMERFEAENIKWGLSECLLVDGDRVIVSPGGKKALVAALDVKTGETVWASEPLRFERAHRFGGKPVDPPEPDIDKAGYASPLLFQTGGRRLIAGCSARHLYCIDAETGEQLWTYPVFARFEVVGSIPVFWRDSLFFSVPDDFGSRMFDVHAGPESVRLEQRWESVFDNCHGAVVLVEGRLYGAGYKRFQGWACLDVATGETRYSTRDLKKGSVVYADGRLYALGERGVMALLEPTPTGFKTAGSFPFVEVKKSDVWAHPVIHDARLYLRYDDTLYCYDIAAQSGAGGQPVMAGESPPRGAVE
jgi:outer membrane protein assembly factor BamB